MKLTGSIILLIAAFVLASAADIEAPGWFVPKLDGTFSWVSKEHFESEMKIQPRAKEAAPTFHLYTRSNPNTPHQLAIDDESALKASNFDKAHATRFVIHGWGGDITDGLNSMMRTALFDTGDYNVFFVDWSSTGQNPNYNSARNSVGAVGKIVAEFIDFLSVKAGLSFNTLGVIGHSLGAHVAGFTGKSVTRGKVQLIVGLDPAMPLFSYSNCATRLCETDAAYVETIQTNGGTLGFLQPVGKSSFYPNGGKRQPGCGLDVGGGCAHGRSVIYYAEAIRNNDFPSIRCGTYEDAVAKECGATYSSVRMGAASNLGVSGYFYVPVRSEAPYGMAG